jgi:hypothetical protein
VYTPKPIRPIVDWKDGPEYKLAKYTSKQLSNMLQLPNMHSIQNLSNFIHNLKNTKIDENTDIAPLVSKACTLLYQ